MTRLQSGRGLLLARIQYTRVPLLYLEVEELYEKGGRYRFDMSICFHCSVQKECETRRRSLPFDGRTDQAIQKSCFICHVKKLFVLSY